MYERQDAPIHEATHRGFNELRQVNSPAVPQKVATPQEEYMVRALMFRNFGDLEDPNARNSQVTVGKGLGQMRPDILNNVEAAAQQEIKRRHPMGPN